jgi:glutamate--cysteine ligase
VKCKIVSPANCWRNIWTASPEALLRQQRRCNCTLPTLADTLAAVCISRTSECLSKSGFAIVCKPVHQEEFRLSSHLQKQLQTLSQPEAKGMLRGISRGIEKESLRIEAKGTLAQTPHPAELGSALTHSLITTDYSEALLEFITPVNTSIEDSLELLEDIHSFVYQKIGDEILWSASMPCIISGDASIPVAQYGSSNVARMKTVYRSGLGHRYGRMMQAIAGIHYNFSMPQAYWDHAWESAGCPGEKTDYISERYLGMIRNFRRYSWLLIYLFGASPAVCSSFLGGSDRHGMKAFDEKAKSLYLPFATALRMGELGYNSDAQGDLNVCYNSLGDYVNTLSSAIKQQHPAYSHIPSGQEGNYQQLNNSLLQIENEFYSSIRPKRVASSGETPLCALVRAGIEYIEVRCVDINPFSSVGLDDTQMRSLDTFLLYCLLQDSPACNDDEQLVQNANLKAVVNMGRQPGLQLHDGSDDISMAQWANELLRLMRPIAEMLDTAHASGDYIASLDSQLAKVADPELTPSARILREMHDKKLPFFRLAMAYSEKWAQYFRERALSADVQAAFEQEAQRSLLAQRDMEYSNDISFEDYLDNFFSQYEGL